MSTDDITHLYPQSHWHDEASIVATPPGLVALRDAIDAALVAGHAEILTYAADGEGYSLQVHCVTDAAARQLAAPYVDEPAQDNRPQALRPWSLKAEHLSRGAHNNGTEIVERDSPRWHAAWAQLRAALAAYPLPDGRGGYARNQVEDFMLMLATPQGVQFKHRISRQSVFVTTAGSLVMPPAGGASFPPAAAVSGATRVTE